MFYLQHKCCEIMRYQVEATQSSLSQQAQKLHLFDDQDQLVGYATGEFRQYVTWFDGQLHFFLYELVVTNPTPRLPKLGNQLLKAVEDFARTKGASWIRGQISLKAAKYTDDSTDDRAVSRFWGTNGYGIKREIYEDAIRFWKPLQATGRTKKPASALRQ